MKEWIKENKVLLYLLGCGLGTLLVIFNLAIVLGVLLCIFCYIMLSYEYLITGEVKI